MIVMAVSGCTGKKPAEQYVSEQLNCSLPATEKAEVSDTHGGFHGEGGVFRSPDSSAMAPAM